MFTQGEIYKVMKQSRTGNGPSIDFDWFDTVVTAASETGVLGHDVEVVTVNDAYMLILVVNGVRFASKTLEYDEEWHEQYMQEPVRDSVLHLLEIAVRVIKEIETARDTWYAAKKSIL